MKFPTLKKQSERIWQEAADKISKPMHARALELCNKIRETYPQIKTFQSGMGAYWFDGYQESGCSIPFADGDGKENTCNLFSVSENTLDLLQGWTPALTEALNELREICDYLQESQYLEEFNHTWK